MSSRFLIIIFLALAVIGFFDATFLTVKFYQGGLIPCSIFHGCDVVTKSQFASFAGVPIALLGAIYYALLFIGAFDALVSGRMRLAIFFIWLTVGGFVASLILMAIQAFILHAYCLYCVISATISMVLFALAMIQWKQIKVSSSK